MVWSQGTDGGGILSRQMRAVLLHVAVFVTRKEAGGDQPRQGESLTRQWSSHAATHVAWADTCINTVPGIVCMTELELDYLRTYGRHSDTRDAAATCAPQTAVQELAKSLAGFG
jgi:hypothetical protein